MKPLEKWCKYVKRRASHKSMVKRNIAQICLKGCSDCIPTQIEESHNLNSVFTNNHKAQS